MVTQDLRHLFDQCCGLGNIGKNLKEKPLNSSIFGFRYFLWFNEMQFRPTVFQGFFSSRGLTRLRGAGVFSIDVFTSIDWPACSLLCLAVQVTWYSSLSAKRQVYSDGFVHVGIHVPFVCHGSCARVRLV